MVHRAGRRAVVRVHGAEAGERYVKLLRPGKADRVAEASARWGELVRAAGGASAALVEVGADRVVFDAVPGQSLRSLPLRSWRAAWAQFARLWPRLAVVPTAGASDGTEAAAAWERHNAHSEAEVVMAWLKRLQEDDPLALDPETAGRLHERARTAVRELVEGVPQSLVRAHRDLHDEQLLYDPAAGRLGFLDFDTAALAEPALDLANLWVHLDLRRAQDLISGPMHVSARAQVRRAAVRCGVTAQRFEAYAEATRLRLVGVYGFRPPWRSLARSWAGPAGL
nr:phosphotransferase [Zhihengliuella flava]